MESVTTLQARKIQDDLVKLARHEWEYGKDFARANTEADLFKIFREAYDEGYCSIDQNPVLTGSALAEVLAEALGETGVDDFVSIITTKWDNWRYALDNYERK